jgi:hypothetical protein
MRSPLLLLAALAACDGTGSIEIGDDAGTADTDGGGGGPTSGGGGDTTGGGGSNGGGSGGANGGASGGGNGGVTDTDGGGDTDLDPFGPDPLGWDGSTVYTFVPYTGRSCRLTSTEAGEQVYGAGYLQLERACPTCQRVFEVPEELGGICLTSWTSPTTVYRGLHFLGSGRVEVFRLSQSGARWTSEAIATGTLAGDVLTFTYQTTELGYKRVDAVATVTLR